MPGYLLRLYVREGARHHGRLLWEWLLETANAAGIRGGSAFRAIGGFGRHQHLHEHTFFELAGSVGVQLEFLVTEPEAARLLEMIAREGLKVPYARLAAELGVTGVG